MAGNSYPITKATTTIGREPGNDIVVTDPSVSRQHAQITWNNGQWAITKLAQANTMSVNQRDAQQSPLKDHDTISLGTGTTFIFQSTVSQAQQPPPPIHQPIANPPRPVYQSSSSSAPAPPTPNRPQPAQQQQGFAPQAGAAPPPPFTPLPPKQTIEAPPYTSQRNGDSSDYPTPGTMLVGADLKSASPASAPTLEVSTNTDHERHAYPLTQSVIDIGRDPKNTIVINRPTVSGFHAQIVREGNDLVLIHPHPTRGKTLNGIIYKGETISGEQQFRHTLMRGDIFRISDENGTMVTLTYNDGSGSAQDIVPEIRPIPLGGALITIGRSVDNMVVLNHPQVSSHHARMEQIPGGYRIVDLGSTNHSYVNAQRIHAQALKPGDEIRIGPFKLTYTGSQLTQHDESSSIRIDALHLTKKGTRQVVLINDISVAIPPRKFVALVGGSGAGKSTLMDALNGLRPSQQGTVLYNGQDYYRHLAAFSTQLGYVPQDDIIHRDLTVERALYYAAKLRLPDDFTRKQIKERINEVLTDVDMRKQRKLLVSKLSGGQRKRVSIALELLANPSVFFLDEPTSGLDPGLDRKMMLLMRKLADKGRTIVLVTHATNNINTCDYVCFLCRGGRLAYFGPPNEAKAFFGKTDFAEIYSALEPTDENPNIPAEAETRFKESADYRRYVVEPLNQGPAGQASQQMPTSVAKPPKRGNPWKQFRILAMRYLELLKNDVGNLAILLLQAPIIGIVLLFLTAKDTFKESSIVVCVDPTNTSHTTSCQNVLNFLNSPAGAPVMAQHAGQSVNAVLQNFILGESGGDAQKILFIMAFAAVLFGCINGSREIVKEAAIYRRERSVNLGIMPYMFSKIVVLGILCLLQSLVLTVFVNLADPFRTSILFSPFIEIYISMALTSLAGLMTGLAISAIVPNNDRAMSIVPLALIPQVIFAGVIFSLDNPQLLQVLGAFFPARWAMAAMGSSIGLHGDKLAADSFSYHGTLFSTFSTEDAAAHLFIAWGALVIMIFLLGLSISWFLKRKDVRT